MISQFSKVNCVVIVARIDDVEGEVVYASHSDFYVFDGYGEITNYTYRQFLINYAKA